MVLTDEQGTAVGAEEVLRAHQDGGLLHRAFSIFVFNRRGETLLQRRSLAKRTFPALWSNACCGHPPPGHEVRLAAERRLLEELGFTVPLREIGTFAYRARDPESGLTEHEYDHVLVGWFGGRPAPDPAEASDWRWTRMEALRTDVTRTPGLYTPWLFSALETLGDAMEDPRSASP